MSKNVRAGAVAAVMDRQKGGMLEDGETVCLDDVDQLLVGGYPLSTYGDT